MFQEWSKITVQALQNAWQSFLIFIPKLLGAIIIFVIGWFISTGIGKLVAEILIRLKVNQFFERTGWKEVLEKAELKVNLAEFIGAICKWILVIVFLSAAVEILGFYQFAVLLNHLVGWLPNLIVAIAIFVVALIIADIMEKIIRASIKKIGMNYVGFFGLITKWGIYIFAGLMILSQLRVAPTIINAIVYAFVGMIALALGLAFGLGGKEVAGELVKELRKKISEK
jgi:hypothetical protein